MIEIDPESGEHLTNSDPS